MMRRFWRETATVLLSIVLIGFVDSASAQQKKIVLRTHYEQNTAFNKWYETRGKDFAKKSGHEVEVVTIQAMGHEGKYLTAMLGKTGAPGIFLGNVYQWCGPYDFCDWNPPDLVKTLQESAYVKGRPDYRATMEMLARPAPPTYVHPKTYEMATVFGEAIVGVLYGKGQPKPLLDQAAAKMEQIMKE